MSESEMPRIELREAMNALREELLDAEAGANNGPELLVNELEVSFEFVANREQAAEGEAKGKLKFWLVDADVRAKLAARQSRSVTQRVTLKLETRNGSGGKLKLKR